MRGQQHGCNGTKMAARPTWLKERLAAEFSGPKKPWGGARLGAGRPRKRPLGVSFNVRLNSLQRLSLEEMGNGNVEDGLQALVDKYL
jgi:hypothetical protein